VVLLNNIFLIQPRHGILSDKLILEYLLVNEEIFVLLPILHVVPASVVWGIETQTHKMRKGSTLQEVLPAPLVAI
jgi:hypothetical protein